MPVVAIPAVAAAMLALLALLILWGAKAFGQALASFIPKNLPVLGDRLHNLILALAATAEAAISWIMADFIRPVIQFVLGPVYRMIDLVDSIYSLGRTMANSWSWLLNSAIPSVIRKVEGYAAHLYHLGKTYAHNLYLSVHAFAAHLYELGKTYAHNLYLSVHAYAGHLYHLGKTYAHDLYLSVHAYAAGLYAKAITYAHDIAHYVHVTVDAEIDQVRKTITSELTVAEHYTDSKIKTAVAGVQDSIKTATAGVIQVVDVDSIKTLAGVWDGVIDDIITLEGVIGTDLPDIGAAVRAIPRAVPLDLSDAFAIVGAISVPMLRYMARCGVPNCRNLSQIGRDLQGLFNVLEGAGFLALIGYMVADPTGAADEAQNVLEPVASGLIDAARGLIGV